jgi:serine O-acetyltransferase
MIRKNRGLEIPSNLSVGKGLYIGHPYNITINGTAVLGKNINIHKGVTIGQENRGKKKGAPTIGNNVWIGINSIIVGKITIGDDVLIAPGAYVNCNVPSHSIVLGNPCKIIPKENATQDYINHIALDDIQKFGQLIAISQVLFSNFSSRSNAPSESQ